MAECSCGAQARCTRHAGSAATSPTFLPAAGTIALASFPHLGRMLVVSCDPISAPGTAGGPLGEWISACLLALLAGCCAAGDPAEVYHTPSCPGEAAALLKPVPACGDVVFVANGSGDFRSLSANLSRVVAETATPLQVETVPWSHGQ